MSRFQKLALSTTVATFALITWGGLVRATGSGDGCPDWPRCFGKWIPPLEYHALIEYTHRFLVNIVVVLIGIVGVAAFRRYRGVPRILWPAVAGGFLVLFQAVLGGIVVNTGLNPTMVTAHFATAMLVIGTQVYLFVSSAFIQTERRRTAAPDPGWSLARLAAVTAGATFALLLVGAYVRGRGAGLAFRDWPLMDGRLVPTLGGIMTVMFVHRVLVAAVFLLVLYAAIRLLTMPTRPRVLSWLAWTLVALFVAQIVVGALNVWTSLAAPAVVSHVALSALIWCTVVALATVSSRLSGAAEREGERATAMGNGQRRSLRQTTVAYVALTKPRIVVLLLITTVPAMVLAEGGMPPLGLVLATLVGGAIAAGSANAVNCYLDRDIDGVMRRTRRRPVPAGQVSPDHALTFGYVLGAVSFFFLGIAVNVLAAALALAAIAFYVFVYTLWLKRTTTQNIVIGGAAGAMPALVGWAAVTGTVGLPAWVLFAIVFVWTPPHFWALAMRYSGDYAAAGVPMLPVVRGEEETRRQILLYSLALFGTSLVLYPVAHTGPVYLATAIVLGGMFVHRALRLWRRSTPVEAMGLFRFSIVYLAGLFTAVAVDGLLP